MHLQPAGSRSISARNDIAPMWPSALEPSNNEDTSAVSSARANDQALAGRLAHSEAAAVDQFCADYTGRVRLYVSARLSDASPTEHDDLTQIVIIAAIKSIKHYRGSSSLLTWVMSIAHNKVADDLKVRMRRKRHEVSISDVIDAAGNEMDIPDTAPENEPEAVTLLNDLRGHVRKALGTLKPEHQEVLVLHYTQELPVAEIATILGLNKRKVEYRLTEARAAFRRALLKLGMDSTEG
jgi:RNA polymerase sigma-70 factor, ECF subfamily